MSRPLIAALLLLSASSLVSLGLAATDPSPPAAQPPERSPAAAPPAKPPPPVFKPLERAVSTWRVEAAGHLVLTPDQIAALRGTGTPPRVARCIKLNNYWCIKKAGWEGELAADGEGHVAFASAVEGAAVAALLLKRYYVDFKRRSAMAIVSHWAPAQCGGTPGGSSPSLLAARKGKTRLATTAAKGLGNTLRARWLSTHSRGFVTPVAGQKNVVKRSVVANRISRPMAAPTIAVGLGEASRPMTLDALMMSSPTTPRSRSMIGMPPRGRAGSRVAGGQAAGGGRGAGTLGSLSGCGADAGRIANYAARAVVGINVGADGDLALFDGSGAPTANLKIMMANMARVEIGPLGPTASLVDAGIAAAFRAGRNPPRK